MTFRSLLGGLCLMAAMLTTAGGQTVAAQPFSVGRFAPQIDTAIVDFSINEIVIAGANLHDGTDPVVTVGGDLIPAPHVLDADGFEMTVIVPALPAGSYVLSLTTSMGTDSIAVSIGEVGPEGPEGPLGETGTFDTSAIQVGRFPGWPDWIQCDFTVSPTTGPNFFYLVHVNSPSIGTQFIYRLPGGQLHDYFYNLDGSFAGSANLEELGLFSNCVGPSIDDLIADGRAFFFLYTKTP